MTGTTLHSDDDVILQALESGLNPQELKGFSNPQNNISIASALFRHARMTAMIGVVWEELNESIQSEGEVVQSAIRSVQGNECMARFVYQQVINKEASQTNRRADPARLHLDTRYCCQPVHGKNYLEPAAAEL